MPAFCRLISRRAQAGKAGLQLSEETVTGVKLSREAARMPHLDLLKAVGAQMIVLHHLTAYGPLSDAVASAAPDLIEWMFDHSRMAVQVFLVIGGYLAARGLAPALAGVAADGSVRQALRLLANRYLRLVPPYLAALGLAVLAAVLARPWLIGDEIVPTAPTWGQALAHVFLLHGVLGYESLSAGVWYVAIDFQLFALMTLLLWLGRSTSGTHWLGPVLVAALTLASLFGFNRHESLDDWAPYFFGAYGMGAASYCLSRQRWSRQGLALMGVIALLAMWVDFRERIVLALLVALVLGLAAKRPSGASAVQGPVARLGASSYALFLVHFPVCLLVNAVFARLGLSDPFSGVVGMLVAWAASLWAGGLFHRWIELPSARLRLPRPRQA
jgi:peptidoglycan/LPS O-acetylase OafA/YrhL